LLLTDDGEATWRCGSERLDGDNLKVVGGKLWPLRRGEEVRFGCGKVWWPVVHHNSECMGEGRRSSIGY
jgi:hypothetical protein